MQRSAKIWDLLKFKNSSFVSGKTPLFFLSNNVKVKSLKLISFLHKEKQTSLK